MATMSNLTARTFEIRSGQRPVRIATDHVYFTFGDGRLSYDCIRCGSKCCRGYGYNLSGDAEALYQLSTRPYARFFLNAVPGDPVMTMKNCPPTCFFLDEDGRCSIHVKHGYDAKPETCRLFPFNAFWRVGNYLIVSPHPELCPLEVMPYGTRSAESDHSLLLDAICSRGIASDVPGQQAVVPEVDSLVSFERRIMELSETYINPSAGTFEEFIDAQFAISSDELKRDALCDEASRPHEIHASTLIEHAVRLLGLDADLREVSSTSTAIDRTMIALTPYLRSQLVLVGERREQSKPDAMHVALDRVPGVVLGVRLMARLAELAGMSSVTFQTVARLSTNYAALLWCIAHAADVMVWPSGSMPLAVGARLRPFVTRYVRVMRDLLPSRQRKARRTLVEVLCEHNIWDGAERLAFLNFVGSHLARLVVPEHDALRGMKAERRVGLRLRRHMLNALPIDVLDQICLRMADRAGQARA